MDAEGIIGQKQEHLEEKAEQYKESDIQREKARIQAKSVYIRTENRRIKKEAEKDPNYRKLSLDQKKEYLKQKGYINHTLWVKQQYAELDNKYNINNTYTQEPLSLEQKVQQKNESIENLSQKIEYYQSIGKDTTELERLQSNIVTERDSLEIKRQETRKLEKEYIEKVTNMDEIESLKMEIENIKSLLMNGSVGSIHLNTVRDIGI
jgi:hypothetical protein